MGITIPTNRERIYNTIFIQDPEERRKSFFLIIKNVLKNNEEFKIPMQLFEKIFGFDFHRGVKHPIASNVVYRFRKEGYKASKVRNKYSVRIRKLKKKK